MDKIMTKIISDSIYLINTYFSFSLIKHTLRQFKNLTQFTLLIIYRLLYSIGNNPLINYNNNESFWFQVPQTLTSLNSHPFYLPLT